MISPVIETTIKVGDIVAHQVDELLHTADEEKHKASGETEETVTFMDKMGHKVDQVIHTVDEVAHDIVAPVSK